MNITLSEFYNEPEIVETSTQHFFLRSATFFDNSKIDCYDQPRVILNDKTTEVVSSILTSRGSPFCHRLLASSTSTEQELSNENESRKELLSESMTSLSDMTSKIPSLPRTIRPLARSDSASNSSLKSNFVTSGVGIILARVMTESPKALVMAIPTGPYQTFPAPSIRPSPCSILSLSSWRAVVVFLFKASIFHPDFCCTPFIALESPTFPVYSIADSTSRTVTMHVVPDLPAGMSVSIRAARCESSKVSFNVSSTGFLSAFNFDFNIVGMQARRNSLSMCPFLPCPSKTPQQTNLPSQK
mmetsp:Transcript_25769/g.39465  ORF Transcript_25769/g.39465 Transcript_25769/m.39465 type:complete len:300 (-) Transcript_25769:286-1185(-)